MKCLQNVRLMRGIQEEEKSGDGLLEVGWQSREQRLNRKRIDCAVIWAPNIVIKGGEGDLVRT